MNKIRQMIANALSPSYGSGSWAAQARLGVKIQGGGQEPDNVIVSGLEMGKILAAVDHLPEAQSSWLKYSIGDMAQADKAAVIKFVINALPLSTNINDKWMALIDIAVDDASRRIIRDGEPPNMPNAAYQSAMGISQQAFAQTWLDRRGAVLNIIVRQIDEPAIKAVARGM